MNRVGIVRKAYERFNNQDYAGALELFARDVEVLDLLRRGEVMRGRRAVLREWTTRFDDAHAEALVAEATEVGDTVFAAVCFQVYDQSGEAFGAPFMVASRFIFDGDWIIRLEQSAFNDIPEDVKALFHVGEHD
jgi:ketosteroid isomerase-like protein